MSCGNQRELIRKGNGAAKLCSCIQMQRPFITFLPSWHCAVLNAYNQGVHRLFPCSTRTSVVGSPRRESMNPSQKKTGIKVPEARCWVISGCQLSEIWWAGEGTEYGRGLLSGVCDGRMWWAHWLSRWTGSQGRRVEMRWTM